MSRDPNDYLSGKKTVAVVGLGYVGLPLAVALASRYRVVGFDISERRIGELKSGTDITGELSSERLTAAPIGFTTDPSALAGCGVIVVTVPTPLDDHRNPDLRLLKAASTAVGAHMAPGTLVVFESTGYPGLTEEECVPALGSASGLVWKRDFNVGYSPERINPGGREHTVEKIVKVVAGDVPEAGDFLEALYGAVIPAGIHRAPDIRTAEAAKVIENTQRDINIALMNELSLIFERMGLDTREVLAAAATKWNFLPFTPGLVGGHCIGVDPYYLTWKAQRLGYRPEVILAGRRINDAMGRHAAGLAVKMMALAGVRIRESRVLILGFTFKENISDIRNTRVVDIRAELTGHGATVDIVDPHGRTADVEAEHGFGLVAQPEGEYDAVILAVKHRVTADSLTPERLAGFFGPRPRLVLDLKGFFPAGILETAGFTVRRL